MFEKIGNFILIVESITFLIITLVHVFMLFFNNFTSVYASYIETLAKNHIESINGTLQIISHWVNSLTTKNFPLGETLIYFMNYKITWVGIAIITFLIIKNFFNNRFAI